MINNNSKYLAAFAESVIKTDLLSKGYYVATPEGDYLPFDLLCITPTLNIYKIQVKTRKIKNGAVSISLRRPKYKPVHKDVKYQCPPYDRKDVDVFAVFVRELNKCFYISSEVLKDHVCEIKLRVEKAKNNHSKKIKEAQKYKNFPLP